jgi:hypothetical protein
MNYWFLSLPRADIEHCIKIGTFGLNRKHILGRMAEGDKVVCCAGKGDWKIVGVGVAESTYYVADDKIFLKDGLFADRFDFKANLLPKDRELDLMTVIDRLSFVTSLAHWAVYFRNGIVEMTKSDWELLDKSINQSPSVKR